MNSKLFLTIGPIICLIATGASAQAPFKTYDDPRIQWWSKQFLEGHREEVLKWVEDDLTSGNPHPFSPQIWVRIQSSFERLDTAIKSASSQLRTALGPLPEITLLRVNGQNKELLAKYPPSSVSTLSNAFSLITLGWVAGDERRYIDAMTYGLCALDLPSAGFEPLWLLSWAGDSDMVSPAGAAPSKRGEARRCRTSNPGMEPKRSYQSRSACQLRGGVVERVTVIDGLPYQQDRFGSAGPFQRARANQVKGRGIGGVRLQHRNGLPQQLVGAD
jgi:hypothetical protein